MVQYLRVHIEAIKVARSETILSVKVLVPIMIISASSYNDNFSLCE